MKHSFLLTKRVSLNANGTGTWQYTVGTKEKFDIHKLMSTATGTYDITDIRDSQGTHYTNASTNEPISSLLLAKGSDNYNNIDVLPTPIHVEGGVTLYVDLLDTSGAGNVVDILMVSTRDYITP